MKGEVINLEQFRKEKERKQKEEKQRLLDDEQERNILAKSMTVDQIAMIEDIIRCSFTDKESLLYKTAFAELKKKSIAEVIDIINNAKEEVVQMKPEYFKAAFNIVVGEYKLGE